MLPGLTSALRIKRQRILQDSFLSVCCRRNSTKATTAETVAQTTEKANIAHSMFLAEAPARAKWKGGSTGLGTKDDEQEFDSLREGKGKLSTTSSHLLKLILPLEGAIRASQKHNAPQTRPRPRSDLPTVILLHPSQPLSHVARLILSSFAPASPDISFRTTTSSSSYSGPQYQWSDSTDVGDFVRDAARVAQFSICIRHEPGSSSSFSDNTNDDANPRRIDTSKESESSTAETIIHVDIPTFTDRTRFLRRRLEHLTARLATMDELKKECDRQAHRGAKRMALGGFGMLVVYWGVVARLTFWDYGWEVMEPVTYLSGLSTVILGYLWFLYRGREVSYSSVLNSSVSARREILYKERGFDIEEWVDLLSESKGLKKEINKIAEDYQHDDDGDGNGNGNSGDDADGKSKAEGEEDEEKEREKRKKIEEVMNKNEVKLDLGN